MLYESCRCWARIERDAWGTLQGISVDEPSCSTISYRRWGPAHACPTLVHYTTANAHAARMPYHPYPTLQLDIQNIELIPRRSEEIELPNAAQTNNRRAFTNGTSQLKLSLGPSKAPNWTTRTSNQGWQSILPRLSTVNCDFATAPISSARHASSQSLSESKPVILSVFTTISQRVSHHFASGQRQITLLSVSVSSKILGKSHTPGPEKQ